MRVFLDANILFSAADAQSATRILLERVLQQGVGVTHEQVWEEAERNLRMKRPQFVDGLRQLRPRLQFSSLLIPVAGINLPDKDVPVLFGAIGAGCSYLWTSDLRHFGALYGQTVRNTKIVSSIMLANEILAAES